MRNTIESSLRGNSRRSLLPDVPPGDHIPKVIYQTYKSRDLPTAFKNNSEALMQRNPGWEYVFFDDDDIIHFISKHYSAEILDSYLRIHPTYAAARVDLFRYLLIYRCGGVYLDLKSSIEKPLDEVLRTDDRYILCYWEEADEQTQGWGRQRELDPVGGKEFQQWHIIAAPGHPYLKAVIETVLRQINRYVPELCGVGAYAVLRTTGPVPYTLAIFPILHQYPFRIATNQALGLRYSIFRDVKQHRNEIENHYAKSQQPLVQVRGLNLILSRIFRVIKGPAKKVLALTGR